MYTSVKSKLGENIHAIKLKLWGSTQPFETYIHRYSKRANLGFQNPPRATNTEYDKSENFCVNNENVSLKLA